MLVHVRALLGNFYLKIDVPKKICWYPPLTVVNNGRFYSDVGTAIPVNNKDSDDMLSNDGGIVPFQTNTNTDDTLSNEGGIVPYKPPSRFVFNLCI